MAYYYDDEDLYDDDDYSDREDDDELCMSGGCSQSTCGDACQECGVPLCPMCMECGAGFCGQHPSENYEPDWMKEHDLVAFTHCPICNQKVDEFAECRTDKPFTAYDPMEGINAWGAFDMPKEIVCYNGGHVVHFKYPGGERLVVMTEVAAMNPS